MSSVAMCKLTPFLALIGKNLFSLSIFLILLTNNENNALAKPPLPAKEAPYTVILDPGHGGEDTGAKGTLIGADKKKIEIQEKDIALAIAKRVEWVLKDPKYWRPLGRKINVVFTRKTDKTVELVERSKIAQNTKADLFLSIHCNFEPSKKVSGVETYILKNDDASADKLARIQAKGDLANHGYAKNSADPNVELLLSSVAADATMTSSKQAAELIQASIAGHLARRGSSKKNRGVRQALLFVLLNAQTPAVLLEAFYMSNPKDLAFLNDRDNRQKIAEGIAMGILRFLAIK